MCCQGDNKNRRFKWLPDPPNIFLGPTYYEEVYLHAYESASAARTGIDRHLTWYNAARPHSSLEKQTPNEAYAALLPTVKLAA